jgi:DNA-binding transcriptional regulator GbsR (MarR family)
MPHLRSHDPYFDKAGLLRSPFKARGLSKPIPMQAAPCVRFRLRAFFGIGIRSEAVIYLLTHPETHADDVARAIGYSLPGVQQVLREMSECGLVHARRVGREKRYWLEKERWSEFLDLRFVDTQQLAPRGEAARRLLQSGTGENARELAALDREARRRAAEELLKREEAPVQLTPMEQEARRRAALELLRPEIAWINWARLYRGLVQVLRFLGKTDLENMSEYVRSSEFARTAELAKDDLEASEKGIHLPSQEGGALDTHVLALQHALEWMVE